MKINVAFRMAVARLRGQIYEAEYALRCIPHNADCMAENGGKCSTKLIRIPGIAPFMCDMAKQTRRIKTLQESLANLLKKKAA